MTSSRADRLLADWAAVATTARRPASPPRAIVIRSGLSGATLAGAALLFVAVVLAGMLLGRRDPNGLVGSTPSAAPNTPAVSASPASSASPAPSRSPSASRAPVIGPCDPASLSARITLWEGAAGHRIAHVELTHAGSGSCTVRSMARPQLVDGSGSVLIDGSSPPTSSLLTLVPGGVLKTLVQDGNYCGPAAVAPVSVAFVLSGGGRILARPLAPTDVTLPPCLGPPGSAGTIEMQPWSP